MMPHIGAEAARVDLGSVGLRTTVVVETNVKTTSFVIRVVFLQDNIRKQQSIALTRGSAYFKSASSVNLLSSIVERSLQVIEEGTIDIDATCSSTHLRIRIHASVLSEDAIGGLDVRQEHSDRSTKARIVPPK